jgi:hypothetical protein
MWRAAPFGCAAAQTQSGQLPSVAIQHRDCSTGKGISVLRSAERAAYQATYDFLLSAMYDTAQTILPVVAKEQFFSDQ